MYLFQRLVQGVLVLLGVTTIVFALTFVAGDPVDLEQMADARKKKRQRAAAAR